MDFKKLAVKDEALFLTLFFSPPTKMVRYEECADYSSDDGSGGSSRDETGDDEVDESRHDGKTLEKAGDVAET